MQQERKLNKATVRKIRRHISEGTDYISSDTIWEFLHDLPVVLTDELRDLIYDEDIDVYDVNGVQCVKQGNIESLLYNLRELYNKEQGALDISDSDSESNKSDTILYEKDETTEPIATRGTSRTVTVTF